MPSTLFSPIKLGGVELENRIVVAPMCQYSSVDGCATDWHIAHLGMLANSGYVDISSGGISSDARNPTTPGYNVPIAEQVRATGIATRTVGLIMTAEQAEDIVATGKADMVALARAILDDPHWGWHAARALGADVRRPNQYLRSAPALWPGAAPKEKAAAAR